MSNVSDGYEDEYEEYDEFDEEEDERGLSGLVVLLMGVVMLGAFFSVVWVAYQQGINNGRNGVAGQTPYVAADPEPVKIETAEAPDETADREVYDVFDGDDSEQVTVLAEGPEEPIARGVEDTIGTLAAEAEEAAAATSQEVEDRLASLAQQDAEVLDSEPEVTEPAPTTVTTPSLASTTPNTRPSASAGTSSASATVSALSGSHLVQVGAFGSNSEAMQNWSRMQSRLGDYVNGKAADVERADLGARGVYHRLRIGPFATADDAKTYCMGLKERGQDCLVKAKS